jgi:Na+/H+-dicarboxylate symporter
LNTATVLAAPLRTSLSTRILLGLGLGVFTGLFFGEGAAALQPVADVYIRLMQMTVLPYLVMALIVGFGQLDANLAKRLALRGGALLLVTWGLTFAVIAAMPLAFPAVENASFFSHALVEPKAPFSVADVYFTANPFQALSNAVVPAVVLFSSMLGVGLIGLPGRERVLDTLRVFNASIVRITRFVVGLTPIGVFAIGAVTTGTLPADTFVRLEVYFIAFTAAALLLAFWILPLMVVAVTPFGYRDVVRTAREALLTAFVASNAFIVLPILVERAKELMQSRGLLNRETDSAAEILIPILFNFPNAGRLLTLLFVPFSAWLAGTTLTALDYPSLFSAGAPAYFAKAQVALPFLMDLFGLPHDLFQLYIPTTIVTGKLDSMVTAMNLLVFALIGAGALGGFLVLRRRRLLVSAAAMLGGIALAVLAVRLLMAATVDTGYDLDEALKHMHLPRHGDSAIVHQDLSRVQPAARDQAGSRLDQVMARGTLRIGYDPHNLPFSFVNADGDLVGLDVELAHALCESLGLRPELVPVAWDQVPRLLEEGVIDLMPSVWYRPWWFRSLRLSAPYLTGTMGFAVADERRHDFAAVERLQRTRGLRIGVPLDVGQVRASIRRYFGDNPVELIPLATARPFFEGQHPDLDAFLIPAENGAAWTLLHPQYSIVVPQPDPVKIPSAFGLARDARDLADLIDEWVLYATEDGTVQHAYDYWVLGRGAEDPRPRWSIVRDVLGWIE